MDGYDLYITDAQHDKLEELCEESDQTPLEWFQYLGQSFNVGVTSCYIRCNTRHDPPLGDHIVRMQFNGLIADVERFQANVLIVLHLGDVT